MTEYQGKSAFSGVAIGKIYVFSKGRKHHPKNQNRG